MKPYIMEKLLKSINPYTMEKLLKSIHNGKTTFLFTFSSFFIPSWLFFHKSFFVIMDTRLKS